jgi:hypothetical protein
VKRQRSSRQRENVLTFLTVSVVSLLPSKLWVFLIDLLRQINSQPVFVHGTFFLIEGSFQNLVCFCSQIKVL